MTYNENDKEGIKKEEEAEPVVDVEKVKDCTKKVEGNKDSGDITKDDKKSSDKHETEEVGDKKAKPGNKHVEDNDECKETTKSDKNNEERLKNVGHKRHRERGTRKENDEVEDKFSKYREMRKEKERKKHGIDDPRRSESRPSDEAKSNENGNYTEKESQEKKSRNDDRSREQRRHEKQSNDGKDPREKEEYEVEKILDKRRGKYGDSKYLVKWKGRSDRHNSWKLKDKLYKLGYRSMIKKFDETFKHSDRNRHRSDRNNNKREKDHHKHRSSKDNSEIAEKKKDNDDKIENYEPESIVDKRTGKGGKIEYLVKWVDQNDSKNSWKELDVEKYKDIIEKYEEERKIQSRKIVVDDDSEIEEEEVEVKKIIEKRQMEDGSTEYLIRWKGFSDDHNSWEPLKNLSCQDLIDEFESRREAKIQKEKRRKKKLHQSKMKFLW